MQKLSPVDRIKRWWRYNSGLVFLLFALPFFIAFIIGTLWLENYIKALAFRAVFGDL